MHGQQNIKIPYISPNYL